MGTDLNSDRPRKTPLYDAHVAAGGQIVPFAGYLMPVQYGEGVIAEHMAVRERAGLFDVSHMGEADFSGPSALDTLQALCTNELSGMADGQIKYAVLCDEHGGAVDDVLVYRFTGDHYLMVLNAANHEKDIAWIQAHRKEGTVVADTSEQVGQIALQGPRAEEILSALAPGQPLPAKNYTFLPEGVIAGVRCLISRTGYTGEDGFELYCAAGETAALWRALLEAGAPFGLIPCGLGARDTLRLEAAMPLYGHELSSEITPLEAGLGFFVKMEKPDFIGKSALAERGAPVRKRMGLRVTGRGIAREGYAVYADGVEAGLVTSGTMAPCLGYPIAMAMLDAGVAIGARVEIDVRGRRVEAEVIKLPFYKRVKSGKSEK